MVEEPLVVNITRLMKCFHPNSAFGLAEVEFDDAVGIVSEGVKDGDFGISTAAEDPVGVEAEADVFQRGRGEHVVELAGPVAEFDVVIVVGEGDAFFFQSGAEFVESLGLEFELGVGFGFIAAPFDG